MKDRRSWLRQYFRNYLLIGVIPVALFALLFIFVNLTSYRVEVENSRYAVFTQLTGSVEHLMGQVELVAEHIAAAVTEADALDPRHEDYDDAYAARLAQTLAACEDQMIWDVPMALFLRGTATLYTREGAMSYAAYQQRMSAHGNLDYTGFFTALSMSRTPAALRLVRDWKPSSPGDMTALIYPLPLLDPLPKTTLCFMLGENVLGELLTNCITDLPGSLHLIRGYKEVLCYGTLSDGIEEAAIHLKGTGVIPLTVEGKEYVAMRSVLSSSGLSVCFICEKADFYRSLHGLWMIFGIGAAAVLALAVFFAVVMTRRSYAPLRRLVNGMPVAQDASGNEFDLIRSHMDAVQEDNQSLNQQLARQKPMMLDACIGKILRGKASTAAEADFLLRCAGIDMSGRSSFAMLLSAQADTAEKAEAFLDELRDNMNLTLPGGGQVFAMSDDMDGLTALMVICPGESGEDPREALAKAIMDMAGAKWPVRLIAGAGSLCAEPTGLHESCMEALAVVREFLPGTDMRFACYDTLEPGRSHVAFPTLDYALLNQSLKQADAAMAHRALEKVVGDIRATDSMLYAQCMCYDVINNILRTVQSLLPQFSAQKIHALCSFRTPEEFQRGAMQLIDEFCQQYASLRETRSSRMREEILAFVAEHVYSYDFSLEQLAEAFSLSQSYLSRFFKQETGYTFTQYITFLRLDRAKRLLAETTQPLKDVVPQVGYVDTASFVRKFKSYEGVTPGQWREMHRQ